MKTVDSDKIRFAGIKNIISDIIYGNKFTVVIRIVMGVMMIYSGFIKALDPIVFESIIMKYNIIPNFFAPYPAIVLPYLEIIIGIFLVIGMRVKASAFLSMGLMVMFAVFIAINIARGESFDCGCFRFDWLGLGISETISYTLLVRNFILFILFLIIFKTERHLFSIENIIEKEDLQNI